MLIYSQLHSKSCDYQYLINLERQLLNEIVSYLLYIREIESIKFCFNKSRNLLIEDSNVENCNLKLHIKG